MRVLVFGACCLVAFLDTAIMFSFGAMFIHLLDKYGESRASTAIVQSLLLGVGPGFGVFSGWILKRTSASKVTLVGGLLMSGGFFAASFATSVLMLDIFVGIVAGIGISLLFVTSTDMVGRLFEKSARTSALAFQTFILGLGVIVIPYILNSLVMEYGVSGTFLILSALFLNNVPISLVFRMYRQQVIGIEIVVEQTNAKAEIPAVTNFNVNVEQNACTSTRSNTIQILRKELQLLANIPYVVIVFVSSVVVSTSCGFLVVLMDILVWKGIDSPSEALACFTAFNIGSTVARAVTVIICKFCPKLPLVVTLVVAASVGSLGQLIVCFSSNTAVVILGCALAGWSVGGVISGAFVVVASLIKPELFGVAIGFLLTAFGLMSVASGPLYGYFRDQVQSYQTAIIVTLTLQATAALLYTAVGFAGAKRQQSP